MKEDDVDSEAGNVTHDDDSDNEDSDDKAEETALADDDDPSSESDTELMKSEEGASKCVYKLTLILCPFNAFNT